MSSLEIKPFNLFGLLKQEITSIEVGRGVLLIHIRDNPLPKKVDLAAARLDSSSGLIFKTMRLTAPAGSFTLSKINEDALALVRGAIAQANKRKDVRSKLQAQVGSVASALASWEALCTKDTYLTAREVATWASANGMPATPDREDDDLIESLSESNARSLRLLLTLLVDVRKAADKRNERYTQKLLQDHKTFFDEVESKPLTTEQRTAVVHDEDNALVVAGAGTGKTSTIVAKVGFLLEKGWAKPEEILLLAFTRKAADEMRERLKSRLKRDLDVKTFHALGLEIIANATGTKPSICVEAEDTVQKNRTIVKIVGTLAIDEAFRSDLIGFLSKFRKPYKSAWEFQTEAAYTQYRLEVELRSFAGGRVRSFEECEIANWLFLNGIKFEYEHLYEINTASIDHRQYKPDFYLPDYGIYIEHWGIARDGSTAPFMDQVKYHEKLNWARKTHQDNNTKLVETFSYERMEGTLLSDLERKLREKDVSFAPITRDEALARLNEAGILDPFGDLVGTFLTHFKSSGSDANAVKSKIGQDGDPARDTLFLKLFAKIYPEYERTIHSRGEIDFEDMIVQASEQVRAGRYTSQYRYLLVDEFQDIAVGRANLICSLRDQVEGAKLFCVGDDWQSIYRFAGGNISLTTEFDANFGFTKRTTLGHTFRFHDKISKFSSRFVQKNPGQLKKELTTETRSEIAGVVVYPGDAANDPLIPILTEINAAGQASVRLLTRYGFNKLDRGTLTALQADFRNLDISELTAHASKGLEADYVIVRCLSRGKHGFPSQIEDDPVLLMVLPESEKFPFAEERRLFYVALTRARKRVYLIPEASNPSIFVREVLMEDEYEKTIVGGEEITNNECPACKSGTVAKRNGPNGSFFFGCSNYPICDHKPAMCDRCSRGWMRVVDEGESHCSACGFISRRCPSCKTGVLVERRGPHSKLWGCTNYRGDEVGSCKYRKNISAHGPRH